MTGTVSDAITAMPPSASHSQKRAHHPKENAAIDAGVVGWRTGCMSFVVGAAVHLLEVLTVLEVSHVGPFYR